MIIEVLLLAFLCEADDALFREITLSIFCTCGCERILVLDCNCKTAEEIKEFVRGRIEHGSRKDEVIEELKLRYGKRMIPISPEAPRGTAQKGLGFMGWIASILAFLAGLSIVVFILKTWLASREGKEREVPSEEVERYRERIERELEKYR
ncbi:MAG TPA: hypothetical protein EYP17_04880 [Candidatus Latescibacteria bacterium]|nr:hypothetical protein [Candidatus Latescibacterota bacterium]